MPCPASLTQRGPLWFTGAAAYPAEWEVRVAGGRMPAQQPGPVRWRKSRHSNPSGNCVEVAGLPAGGVAVRDSRDPGGPVLLVAASDWRAFVRAVRGGDQG